MLAQYIEAFFSGIAEQGSPWLVNEEVISVAVLFG
jgi:hypothetical protein